MTDDQGSDEARQSSLRSFLTQARDQVKSLFRDAADLEAQTAEFLAMTEQWRNLQLTELSSIPQEERARIAPRITASTRVISERVAGQEAFQSTLEKHEAVIISIQGSFFIFFFYKAILALVKLGAGPHYLHILGTFAVIGTSAHLYPKVSHLAYRLFGQEGKSWVLACSTGIACLLANDVWYARPFRPYIDDLPTATEFPRVPNWLGNALNMDILSTAATIIAGPMVTYVVYKGFVWLALLRTDDLLSVGPRSLSGTALLLDGLLEIAVLLERIVNGYPEYAYPRILRSGSRTKILEYGEPYDVPYVAQFERKELVRQIESLARLVEGKWRRAILTGDRQSDISLNDTTGRIAAALRRWKAVGALGGEPLDEMRYAFAVAVINAADGNWHLLAAEQVSTRERVTRRVLRWARNGSSFLILIGLATFVASNPFGWSTSAAAAGTLVPVSLLVIHVAHFLDPKAGERLSGYTRLAAELGIKK
ncbi:hypothetical protein ACF07Y_15785 [Streptomyces sp. NPDC016566]|uniref:hypothetical protein n=1 Tax=Streptomyces sp. NPDC016566 TaxID=3364967 RepID=UPI0036F56DD5